jgi:hypothetical protein
MLVIVDGKRAVLVVVIVTGLDPKCLHLLHFHVPFIPRELARFDNYQNVKMRAELLILERWRSG